MLIDTEFSFTRVSTEKKKFWVCYTRINIAKNKGVIAIVATELGLSSNGIAQRGSWGVRVLLSHLIKILRLKYKYKTVSRSTGENLKLSSDK